MSPIILILLIAIVAFLYASVGHGGASGYLALMILFGMNIETMKTSALILNTMVSSIAFYQYYKKGFFKWSMLLPFIILSIPLAFVGAKINIETHTYKIILAVCLVIATARIIGLLGKSTSDQNKTINFTAALFIGALIGLISGIIGIGGGIILTPVLLLLNWASIKESAAISAAFIFVNSIAGLAAKPFSIAILDTNMYVWITAALLGGSAGAYFGSHKFNNQILKYVLSAVLLLACTKLIFS
jgi:uncharacterized membrane protein YfcA